MTTIPPACQTQAGNGSPVTVSEPITTFRQQSSPAGLSDACHNRPWTTQIARISISGMPKRRGDTIRRWLNPHSRAWPQHPA